MREIRWSWAIACGLSLLVASRDSHGQAAVLADKLFRQAVDYMNAGDFSAACPLLERSYQFDPKDGTLFTLANCRDLEGKLVAAAGHYRAYLLTYEKMTGATRQKHKERGDKAQQRVGEIDSILPNIKLVWETAPSPDAKIIVDGVEFRADTLDVLLPLDPGNHVIVIKLPGEPDRTRTITLEKGGSTIIDLTPAKPSDEDATTKVNIVKQKKVITPKARKAEPMKVAGFVGIGMGAAGLVAGGVTGWLAKDQKDTVDARCNATYVCDAVGYAAVERFRLMGTASTVSFIAGGVLAGVGGTLLLVSKRAQTTGMNWQLTTAVLPGNANISLQGAF